MEVMTGRYQFNYGRKPKGEGVWFFRLAKTYQRDTEVMYSGKYGECLKRAKAAAKDSGCHSVEVLP